MAGLGDEFRAAREARHLSLSDVSERSHIRSVYLQGIEDEDWGAIAAPVYVRGFLRTYARLVGVDPEYAVERFNAALGQEAGPVPLPPQSPFVDRPKTAPSPWLWLAAGVATVLVGLLGYNVFSLPGPAARATPAVVGIATPGDGRPAAAAAVADVAARAPRLVSARQLPQRSLVVELTQRSWLAVRVDGAPAVAGVFPAGTRKAFHGRLADVRAGNAGGVDLTVNGKALGPMGNAGRVVERRVTLAEE